MTLLTARPHVGGLARRSRLIVACLTALASVVSCASASAALNLTGTWSANYHCAEGVCPGGQTDFPAIDRLTQAEGSDVVSGSNEGETISGTLIGNTFTFTSTTSGYEAKAALTVAANGLSWSGPLEDSNGTKGTYTARRNPPPSGSLSQLPSPSNCVSVEGAGGDLGCGTLIASGLEDQVAIAVSPDGRDVYATGSNALIEFSRNQATGALTEIGCVTGGTVACAPENDQAKATAMNDPATVAISPNGDSVYVATEEAGAVVSFSRDSGTGLLTETGCVSHDTATGCAVEGAPGMKEPGKVQVSSDEKNVYVTSFGEQAVAEFERSTSGAEEGALKQLPPPNECISSEPATKCKTTAVGLNEVSGLALSSDGKNLYAAATGSGGSSGGDIAEFERHTSGSEEGALTQLAGSNACLTSTGVTGCASALDINGSGELIVSPDGQNVYANSFVENAILEFSRESSGELKQLAGPNTCISSSATTPSGCTSVKGIEESFGMAISPDGSDLYATGIADNAVATFERSASGGALTQFAAPYECITENAAGCGTNKAVGLEEAWLPVISPDGANVYVGGAHGQLVELARSRRLGGLNIAGYCESLGDDGTGSGSTTLLRGAVEGPEYAYENWACVEDNGNAVQIAVSGPAPSMNNACAHEFPSASSYGYPESANNAYTWNCYTLLPVGEEKAKEKEEEKTGGGVAWLRRHGTARQSREPRYLDRLGPDRAAPGVG